MTNTKELAKTGLFLPPVGLGTWDYHAGAVPLRKGLESGALFVDTAESYGSEITVGQAVKGIREKVFIATKVSPQNFRAGDLKRSVDGSLQRLAIDRIDLLQLHQPNSDIPIEETMGALADCVDAGKVRFIGVCNFSVSQLQSAQRALGRFPVVSNQVRYSLIDRTIEKDLLPYCQTNSISVIAYSPLGRQFRRILDCDPTGVIDKIASRTGKSPAQVVINWCICKDNVLAIPKGNSEAHILDNCGASGWRLTAGDIVLLDTHIQFRRRGRFDELARRYMPQALRGMALKAMNLLPRTVRRRVS